MRSYAERRARRAKHQKRVKPRPIADVQIDVPQTKRFKIVVPITVSEALRKPTRDALLAEARQLVPAFDPEIRVDRKGVVLTLVVPGRDKVDAQQRGHYWAQRTLDSVKGARWSEATLEGLKVRAV